MNKNISQNKEITVQDIAKFLNLSFEGNNLKIIEIGQLSNPQTNQLIFVNQPQSLKKFEALPICWLVDHRFQILKNTMGTFIKVDNPKLTFAKIVQKFFTMSAESRIAEDAVIGADCKIGFGASIGHGCIIGNRVTIGENVKIGHHVIISDNAILGNEVVIKSGTCIGEDGFGFAFEKDGTPIRIPHLGKVHIGDRVEIGSKCTIARGTIGDTVIASDVKIDDQVHIAHNCHIGNKTIITACVEISGSVNIGERCWLAPNVSIINGIVIKNNVTIGIGAVVTKDVPEGQKIMGLEALPLRLLIKLKKNLML